MQFKRLVKTLGTCTFLLLLFTGYHRSYTIRYLHTPTIQLPVDTTVFHIVDFGDEVSNDTLLQSLSKEGYPIRYSRAIRTGVCFDNKCRPLDVVLHWNVTGRYLGFELPKKEFLSKYDHEPFTEKEYQRLHELLTDSLSPLGGFYYNEVVPQADSTYNKVDAVSGATSANVLEYVVEGAALTTYKLWHLVYGPTQPKIQALTRQRLSPELLYLILTSSNMNDRMWALNHVQGYVASTPEMQALVLSYISSSNYSLAERAINSINQTDLQSDVLQARLMTIFLKSGHSTKKLLLLKLKEAPKLSTEVADVLRNNLQLLNGELLATTLDLFIQQGSIDLETSRAVSELLVNTNSYVSKMAFSFLEKVNSTDETIKKRLTDYRAKQAGSGVR
ncbi:hypothetical protein [Telluribacter humicola]|uniref:hypothetical protein n=1 Tax=Telluribacter humicola TaxID=1720261 RepID=UPI001A965ABA|nr:hypothetical protein [Telluribacter humicola]